MNLETRSLQFFVLTGALTLACRDENPPPLNFQEVHYCTPETNPGLSGRLSDDGNHVNPRGDLSLGLNESNPSPESLERFRQSLTPEFSLCLGPQNSSYWYATASRTRWLQRPCEGNSQAIPFIFHTNEALTMLAMSPQLCVSNNGFEGIQLSLDGASSAVSALLTGLVGTSDGTLLHPTPFIAEGRLRDIVSAVLTLRSHSVPSSTPSPAVEEDLRREVAELRAENAALRARNLELTREIDRIKADLISLQERYHASIVVNIILGVLGVILGWQALRYTRLRTAYQGMHVYMEMIKNGTSIDWTNPTVRFNAELYRDTLGIDIERMESEKIAARAAKK